MIKFSGAETAEIIGGAYLPLWMSKEDCRYPSEHCAPSPEAYKLASIFAYSEKQILLLSRDNVLSSFIGTWTGDPNVDKD